MKKIMILILSMVLIGSFSINYANAIETTDLKLSFASNPLIVSPGTNGYLELTISNIGTGTVEYIDISARIYEPQVIESKGNWDVYVGDLDGGSYTTLLYEYSIAEDANPGLYQIVFEVDSNVPGDIKQTQIIKIEDDHSLDIESVSPRLITSGKETTLTFTIANNGGVTVKNILFTWKDQNNLILPAGADNRITISSIPAGNSSKVPIDVVVSPTITPGVYPLGITMEFYDSTGTKQTVSSEVGIQVDGTIDFEIIIQEMIAGTTFAVANSGANTASSVIVSIPHQLNYHVSSATSVSLGNLDAGDYTLATFQISQTNWKNNTQSNGLIVEISYTDLFGVRKTIEKEVDFTPPSSNGVSSQFNDKVSLNSGGRPDGSTELQIGMIYIIIGAVGIILIVVLLQLGKRNKIPHILKILKRKKQ